MTQRNAANSLILLVFPAAFCAAGAAFADGAGGESEGQELFKRQCAACHTLDPEAPPRQGPPLHDIFGRKAGTIEGFKYSSGLAEAGVVWDEESLDAWLTNPQKMIKGTFMSYRQARPEVREKVIAFLKHIE